LNGLSETVEELINIEKIDLIEEVKDIKTPQEEIETKVSEKIEMIKEILEITEEEGELYVC
jgi:hypothetical protein